GPKAVRGGDLGLLRRGRHWRSLDLRFFCLGFLHGPPSRLCVRLAGSGGRRDWFMAGPERAATVAALMSLMTLGQALAAHVRLIVWCKSCNHRAEPDIATQVAQHGAGFVVAG